MMNIIEHKKLNYFLECCASVLKIYVVALLDIIIRLYWFFIKNTSELHFFDKFCKRSQKIAIFSKKCHFFQKITYILSTTVPRISTWEYHFETKKARLNDSFLQFCDCRENTPCPDGKNQEKTSEYAADCTIHNAKISFNSQNISFFYNLILIKLI